jgi:MoxR-like ATPase
MRFGGGEKRQESDPIVAPGDVVQLQKVIALLPCSEPVRAYLVRLLRSTREHPDVLVGASPRALLSMYRCTQAAALLDNAAEVAVKHVRSLFEPCIAHRIRVRPEGSARAVCEEILERTPVPVTTPPPTIAATDGLPKPGAPVQLAA